MNDHTPVLLQEVIEALNVQPGKKYIDATVGMGGHAREIVKKGGIVLGIDRDQESLDQLRVNESQFHLAHGSFRDIKEIAYSQNFVPVDGILFDLGFSSWQLDKAGRGFSFMKDEPLDLRFDRNTIQTTASEILNTYSREELTALFARYGELNEAGKISELVVRNRPIKKTSQLNAVIAKDLTEHMVYRLLARIYQALRIAVNEELRHIEIGLLESIDLLCPGGRLCVISFHSLEDRIVKLAFNDSRLRGITKKPITASKEEIHQNSRARSTKLRIAEKI
ncbi:MAG: Ribosomal RNA small subunit methyltransferase H [Candidatus Roizmanbacteria bacterium GW2011_GWC2_41_7]|uniref:Ribosomal RNA small subunit methyltransferase H n=1 Tax=Candidatus Roizmanbacteria bacterium GW2011_GWC2_41_7 TaxID=1618487 RepID=A0A0G0X6N9_9BACT|nr:MAG: Ribosomal RNA small subunit methyltransferase H [Candidatus Roizmanbacteria bacterium GW2011_GWC2_41_7]